MAGNGFYYLMGDIARLHSAVISYARDFMINRGFTYCVPPFMIRSNVVTGVMSFAEMEDVYKRQPVKIQAMEYGIPVYQPAKVREASFVEVLQGLEADVYVVIAFGQLLPKAVLELPKYGCINIHASLLPKYRGAAPIQWCIIDGERETGITTMMMDVGLDTGDMLEKAVIPIEEKDRFPAMAL